MPKRTQAAPVRAVRDCPTLLNYTDMKDKNSYEIKIGDSVLVPDPNDSDIHSHEFIGNVTGFRNGNVQVTDQNDDCIEIEPERLEVQ